MVRGRTTNELYHKGAIVADMNPSDSRVLVTGAGGFIGHHLVTYLKAKGYWVRGVDIKRPEYEETKADDFLVADLRNADAAIGSTEGIDEVYHLAADMGGIGYITGSHAEITRNNTLIDLNMLDAAIKNGVKRFFYSSSACVYAAHHQEDANVTALKEEHAWPADPEPGYGLEKLYTEELCKYYQNDHGLETRVARFHNVYGPLGAYDGGKEKAPAAICRKVASLPDGGEIEIWGDGKQTRSFMYIDDCLEGVHRLMRSDRSEPINLGTEEIVTIDELVDTVSKVAGKALKKVHDPSKPQGVRGRNSDNTILRKVLGWEPSTRLETGLGVTYEWIAGRVGVTDSR